MEELPSHSARLSAAVLLPTNEHKQYGAACLVPADRLEPGTE